MTKPIKTGKDTYLSVLPALNPASWPTGYEDGFESILVADPDIPVAAELYDRNNAICSLSEWTRQCKTTATINQGSETADVSDDCNPDATIISKLTRSIQFDSFNRKGENGIPIPGSAARRLQNGYKSEGCLLVPILWTDCPLGDDGASGIFMLASITDFNFTGNLNDPVSISFTASPGATPFRSDGTSPMRNVLCVSRFTTTTFAALIAQAPDFYDGEIAQLTPAAVDTSSALTAPPTMKPNPFATADSGADGGNDPLGIDDPQMEADGGGVATLAPPEDETEDQLESGPQDA